MGQVLVDSNSLTAIAEAIRSKNKKVIKYKPAEMAGAIKALALDNSVVIQSNDAWKYAIDSTLEHQNINVAVNIDLMGNNTTGYKSKITFDPTINSNFGYIAGTIKKTIDSTNHIVNFSANPNPATETNRLTQDGWAPVYIISTSQSSKNYYTTTTPDDVNSFKSISSSDNIENILICGYYTKDNSTGKLSLVDSDKNYVGKQLVSTYTKKIKNTYATSIGDYAFRDCSALTSIDLPNATSIGAYAFYNCSALTSIDLPNATSIGAYAFYNCSALTSIDLPNATSIGDNAFRDCNKLTSIDVSNATSIGDYAFRDCSALTSIDLPNATSIGAYAFYNCSALTSIDLPNATSIGDCTFDNCNKLTSIDLPNATSIGNYAFYICSALTSIDVSNATSIGDYAFANCNKLTSIDVSNATSIGNYAFYNCRALTSIDVSNATSIGAYAFYNCSALTSIDVSNATSIGDNAFYNCRALKFIIIDSNTVSTAHVKPQSEVKVLIPQSMMDAYAADSYWSSYTSYLDAIENYTITRENGQITVQKKITPNITYNGNMNVFLCDSTLGPMFTITTGTKKDSVSHHEYTYNEAFALSLADDGEIAWERLCINYKDNFYNLDPNANYKITAIKIGDISLSDADISNGSPEISSTTFREDTYIDAYLSKTWVKSVYKQCTGKELELSYVDDNFPIFEPADPIISTIPVNITFTKVTQ